MDSSALLAEASQRFNRSDLSGALALYDQILAADPKHASALFERARVLLALHQHEDVVIALGRYLALNPTSAFALMMRGESLMALRRYERAFDDFDLASAFGAGYAAGTALNLSMRMCRWDDFDVAVTDIRERSAAGDTAVKPYHLLSIPSSPDEQRTCAERYYATVATHSVRPAVEVKASAKIRVGYFSTDFRDHAVSHLVSGLLRAHDRSRFEVIAFTLADDPFDPVRNMIAANVDHFVNIAGLSPAESAARAREMGVHIAVDMNVYLGPQPAIFSCGAAPIQVSYLGYAGTSGGQCYDYIVGDAVITPREHAAHFSERLVILPHAYQPTDFHRFEVLPSRTRETVGLPASGFVFCCFNDSFKITPDVFDVWMRLLKQVDGSVLWLLATNDVAMRNLRTEAEKRGVAAKRLIFAPRAPLYEHLARHRAADLFLDTFHYNAHTTASDALWAGLPLLTKRGDTFAARVAVSLITAAGIPELITHGVEAYEQLALDLATDPAKLTRMKAKLAQNRMTCPLFDTVRYTRNLERAYEAMWARHQTGLAPDHITVVEP